MKRSIAVWLLVIATFFIRNIEVVLASPPVLEAEAAILIDARTGAVIYEKNAHEKKYPASITKLMTALLFLENLDGNLDQRIEMSYHAIFSTPAGSTNIAMNDGESLSAREALYAMMLESANEVSNAVAEYVAGDLESFAIMMTARALELGAENTNFANAHGFHDPNHYTTAYDMALIQRELLKFPEFLEIISTNTYFIPPTERQPEERPLLNSHRMINPHENEFFNPNVVGGKTGFHNEARHTLTTYIDFDEFGMIAVILDAPRLAQFYDTQRLFDYGESLYTPMTVFSADAFEKTLDIVREEQEEGGAIEVLGTASVIVRDDFVLSLPDSFNIEEIETEIFLPAVLTDSVYRGKVLGSLHLLYQDHLLGALDLISDTYFEYPEVLPATVYTQVYETYSDLTGGFVEQFYETTGLDIHLDFTEFLSLNHLFIGIGLGLCIYHIFLRYRRAVLKKRFLTSASRGRLRSHDRYALGGRKDVRASGRFFRE